MSTVPDAVRRTLSSVTTPDLLDDFHTYFAANSGSFTISNVIGSPVTSFTATHTDSWQINLRVSGTDLYVALAPEGGIADSSAPTGTDLWEEVGITDISSGVHAQYLIAIFDDAITILTKVSANTHVFEGIHAGKIMSLGRSNYPSLGRDGLGMLCGAPTDNAVSSGGKWFTTTAASARSKIRIASGGFWGVPIVQNIGGVNTVNASARFHDLHVIASADDTTNASSTGSPTVGLYKYLTGDGDLDASPLTVINSGKSGSTQAYLALQDSVSSTRLRLLWLQGVAA